jgi:ATP-dependent DNA helicase DinG
MFKNVAALVPGVPPRVTAALYAQGEVVGRVEDAAPDELLTVLPHDCVCLAHGEDAVGIEEATDLDLGKRLLLDTQVLARVLLPTVAHYDLASLAEALGLPPLENKSGSDALCEVVLDLFAALTEIAIGIAPAVLFEMTGVLKGPKHRAVRKYLDQVQYVAGDQLEGQQPQSIVDGIAVERLPKPRQDVPLPEEYQPLDVHQTEESLGKAGPFAAHLSQYEWREGQIKMARSVVEAFNTSSHLMVEAGTGTGKSLAYLVPAVQWALQNKTPVVVSTNTKNLQSQLFEKDLPLIQRVLGSDFKTALIKGRGNYLCIRKLLYLLDHAGSELKGDERVVIAAVLPWVTSSQTGDLTELGVLAATGSRGLASNLSSTAEECAGRGCRYYRQCFLRRARAKSMAADVVVANHALVFAEMNMKSQAIPPHSHLILDEAHNIEDAATRHFSIEVSASRIRFPLRRLGQLKKRGGRGLLASLSHQISSGSLTGDVNVQEQLLELCRRVDQRGREVDAASGPFFDALAGLLRQSGPESRRLGPDDKKSSGWRIVEQSESMLRAELAGLTQALGTLVTALRDLEVEGLGFHAEFIQDLEAQRAMLIEVSDEMGFMLSLDDDGFVYWVERDGRRRQSARGWAAPIEIGDRLWEDLYQQKSSVIFTSATLSVRGSFKFLQQRLGIDRIGPERLLTLDAGTPFDYAEQCTMLVPMFLPEPNDAGSDYGEALGDFLAELFQRTRGRGLALFTSYAMLQKTTRRVREKLTGGEVDVLAQGESVSREALTERFREDVASVLMGTHSFWEGVDVVGESLSCVVLARLPFAVFTDPIVAARCEQIEAAGGNAFMHYSIPNAVIRFRQGFGRLIRHRNDRGVVIVADRRIATKRYGQWFRNSVPSPALKCYDSESMIEAVEEFLAGT